MMVSRVKVGGEEKWVGFIGGGHNYSSCTGIGCDSRGKGFFIIDLSNGNVLWSYTMANNTNLSYAMPGTAAIVVSDNDGFVDIVYMGDLGGEHLEVHLMYRLQLGLLRDSKLDGLAPV
jgi:type IV pilus assembly protein PilY1